MRTLRWCLVLSAVALLAVRTLIAYGPGYGTQAYCWTSLAVIDTTNRTINVTRPDGSLPKMVKVYNDNAAAASDLWFRFDGGTCADPASTNALTASDTQRLRGGESQEYQVTPSIISFRSATSTCTPRFVAVY